ncbi:MAG: IS4 family transposase [Myxococcales bacterium]|nr:IS4 family transposase [Myxococcales bacterium]
MEALAHGGRLWLTALGRDMRGPALEKHRIKSVDRLLGNHAMQEALPRIYQVLASWLLAAMTRPVVLVDWTGCGPGLYLLRAGLPLGGRAILLHARVVTHKKLANKDIHEEFLRTLATIIPAHCRPIIVTDAGFHSHWFAHVSKLGWDFVGRMRGRFHARFERCQVAVRELHRQAGNHPKDLGRALVGLRRGGECRLVLGSRPRPGGRTRLTRKGTPGQRRSDHKASAAAKEPWLLATSLTCAASKVVAIYATRMQLEESFRDLKSHRFGWSFECARSKDPRRIGLLLLIATLASLATLVVGIAGERLGLSRQFQANTVRSRRVLSLMTLGRRIINLALEISDAKLCRAVAGLKTAIHGASPLEPVPI